MGARYCVPVRFQGACENNGVCPWNTLSIMDTLILLGTRVFGRKYSWTEPCRANVGQRYGGDDMIWGTELRNVRSSAHLIEQLSQLDDATTLIEVSVAALTTEPDLRDVGRSLISLARYYAGKKMGSVSD